MKKPHIWFEGGFWVVQRDDPDDIATGVGNSPVDAWADYIADASQCMGLRSAMDAHTRAIIALRPQSVWRRLFG